MNLNSAWPWLISRLATGSGAELMQGVPNAASAQDQLVGGVFSFCIEPKPQRRGFFSKKQWSSGWEVVQFGWLPRVR